MRNTAAPPFEAQDAILRTVERRMRALSEEMALREPAIELWRWDTPSATLSWTGTDFISRSINAFLTGAAAFAITVEVNAWQDVQQGPGGGRVRYWQHLEIATMREPNDKKRLDALLHKAYDQVVNWNRDALERTEQLPALPV